MANFKISNFFKNYKNDYVENCKNEYVNFILFYYKNNNFNLKYSELN